MKVNEHKLESHTPSRQKKNLILLECLIHCILRFTEFIIPEYADVQIILQQFFDHFLVIRHDEVQFQMPKRPSDYHP